MPNGGSDCCGTCWFNRTNDGRAGFPEKPRRDRAPSYCEIRHLDVPDPFYTYCANHPHRNPGKIPVPIGPAFTGDSQGNREPLHPSPDTEEIRQAVLELLHQIPEQPTEQYPIGLSLETVIIWQLAEWEEHRALPGLERIMGFGDVPEDPNKPFAREQTQLKNAAGSARSQILGE